MKEIIYKKIYAVSMGILGASLLLTLVIHGVMPLGITAVWSESGIGSSMLLVRPDSTVTPGKTVVGNAETQGKVHVYIVQEVIRQNGVLNYKVMNKDVVSNEVVTMKASDLNKVSVLSIPLAGVWVKILSSTIGSLTLIGLPFFMLAINTLLVFGRKLLPVLRVLERRAQVKKQKKIEQKELAQGQEEMQVAPETEGPKHDHGLVTVLKPYSMRQRYSV